MPSPLPDADLKQDGSIEPPPDPSNYAPSKLSAKPAQRAAIGPQW